MKKKNKNIKKIRLLRIAFFVSIGLGVILILYPIYTNFIAGSREIVDYDLPADAAEDSCSILPALRGEELDCSIREATVHHSLSGVFALRQ